MDSRQPPSPAVDEHPTSFGAFKPEGQVLLCFPDAPSCDAARERLVGEGTPAADIRRYSDQEMLEQAEADLARASAVADFGQEINLLRFQREASQAGSHWLLVKAGSEAQAGRISHAAQGQGQRQGATRALYYGRFLIVELIPPPAAVPQRSESPARGLDPGLPRDSTEQP
ncbi:MAG TPA: hypothetical protein VK195_07015 [Burkholderiaceae bacterium]|nr:hypothetical protein [Burkholderiaceae bacterium]